MIPSLSIVHLTSAHARYDTRIFLKMCTSLAQQAHYTVYLVVADGKGDEIKNNVHICDVGAKQGGRLARMTKTVSRVFERAKVIDADVYHLHDPELMPIGIKLKKLGKKVIFDAHEDAPKQMLSKPYLNKPLLWIIAKALLCYETWACKKFDAIVTATPFIRDKFKKINANSIDVNNYPLLNELANTSDWAQKKKEVAYVGGVATIRGIEELVEALSWTDEGTQLNLCGIVDDKRLEITLSQKAGWARVNAFGFVGRDEMRDVLARSMAGVVTFHPVPNHVDAQPNKMFEYMSAGIPVIASNFPLWREIIEGNDCGICVDPLNPREIASAINLLVNDMQLAIRMGGNGRSAVVTQYNWQAESSTLLAIYEELV